MIFSLRSKQTTLFEERYYGPYDKLFNYCFDSDNFKYSVSSRQIPDEPSDSGIVDFVTVMIVNSEKSLPVLIAEIKDECWADRAETRRLADEQIRRGFDAVVSDCPSSLLRLWGLSLLGTSTRIYCVDIATRLIQPTYQAQPGPTRLLPPSFLKNERDLDLLSQEGFERMKEIVDDILSSVTDL